MDTVTPTEPPEYPLDEFLHLTFAERRLLNAARDLARWGRRELVYTSWDAADAVARLTRSVEELAAALVRERERRHYAHAPYVDDDGVVHAWDDAVEDWRHVDVGSRCSDDSCPANQVADVVTHVDGPSHPVPTAQNRYEVVTGASVSMCGHAEYLVRRVGQPGNVSFLAGSSDQADRLAAWLNRDPAADPVTDEPGDPPTESED